MSLAPADSRPYAPLRVRGGVRAFVEGHAIAGAIGVVVALVLVRTMEPLQYAVYATIPALVVFAVEIASFGLPAAVARFVPDARLHATPHALARLVWKLLAWRMGLVLVATLALAATTPVLARLLNLEHAIDALYVGYAYFLAYACFSHLQKTLEALLAQAALKRGMIVEWAPKAVILFTWIAIAGAVSAREAIAVHAITAAAGALVLLWRLAVLLRRLAGEGVAARITGTPASAQIIECARNQWIQTVLVMPSDANGLRILAAALLPTGVMAAFGFHHILASLLGRYLPVQLFIGLVDSLVVARYLETHRFEAVSDVSAAILKLNLFALTPMIVGGLAIGGELTHLVTGGRYAELAWILPAMLAAIACESAWFIARAGANAVSRTGLLVNGALVALAVLALVVALAVFGFAAPLTALAIAGVAAPAARALYVFSALAGAGYVYRFDWSGIVRIVVLAIAATLLGRGLAALVAQSPVPVALVTIAIAVPAYLGLAALWRPFNARERELIGHITGRQRFPW